MTFVHIKKQTVFLILFSLCGFLFVQDSIAFQKKTQPFKKPPIHKNAHAHNDYLHDRPLLDALENGFCSVEADILLVKGRLLVAHSYFETNTDKTLEKLYLKPLQDRIKKNGGKVHHQPAPFRLLIDIKTDAKKTFEVLDRQLKKYPDVFCHFKDGKWHQRPVLAIISGNRPKSVIKDQSYRIATVDGRISELGKKEDSKVMPLISDRWGSHFKWKGRKEFPEAERKKLIDLVKRTHAENKILRFWAIPDKKNVWKVVHDCGVDLINTDKLKQLNQFLTEQKSESKPATK